MKTLKHRASDILNATLRHARDALLVTAIAITLSGCMTTATRPADPSLEQASRALQITDEHRRLAALNGLTSSTSAWAESDRLDLLAARTYAALTEIPSINGNRQSFGASVRELDALAASLRADQVAADIQVLRHLGYRAAYLKSSPLSVVEAKTVDALCGTPPRANTSNIEARLRNSLKSALAESCMNWVNGDIEASLSKVLLANERQAQLFVTDNKLLIPKVRSDLGERNGWRVFEARLQATPIFRSLDLNAAARRLGQMIADHR